MRKLLAKRFKLGEVAEEGGRWTVTLLEGAVEALTVSLASMRGWDAANHLHVWGLHEAKIEVKGVKARKQAIERLANRLSRKVPG